MSRFTVSDEEILKFIFEKYDKNDLVFLCLRFLKLSRYDMEQKIKKYYIEDTLNKDVMNNDEEEQFIECDYQIKE